MKKNLFFLFSLFFPFCFSAQSVDSTDERYRAFFYEDGSISSEGYIEKGKPNGYWITYYPNGIKESEGNRINFELEGNWKFYNESGKIKEEINYQKGEKDGIHRIYNQDGYLITEENFENGIKEGMEITYYPDSISSIIKEKIPYQNDQKDGFAYEYGKDGRIISITEYKNGFLKSKEKINRKDSEGRKQGIWKKFYPNGRMKEEARYKDDLLNGYLKLYSSNGKLESASLYIKGEKQSDDKNIADFDINSQYYKDGTLKATILKNKAGKKDGVSNYFNKDGTVEKTEIYRNGFLFKKGIIDKEGRYQGVWESYYLNGKLKSKGEYKDGKKVGKWKFYFTNGKLEQEGFFNSNGEYTGEWKWYYEDGSLLRREDYRRGMEDGYMEEYDRSGNIISKGEYLDGKREGEWVYELNDHKETGKYRYDQKDGFWEFRHANGKIAFEGNFLEGIPHGTHKYYNQEGVLIKEENYEYGEKDGKWIWYDQNGFETFRMEYKNGEEHKINGQKVKFTEK